MRPNSVYCFTVFVAFVTVVELLHPNHLVLLLLLPLQLIHLAVTNTSIIFSRWSWLFELPLYCTITVVTSTITTTTLKPCVTNPAESTTAISNPKYSHLSL